MKRHTAVPPIVYTLTPAFGNDPDKVIQWKAFVSKNSFT